MKLRSHLPAAVLAATLLAWTGSIASAARAEEEIDFERDVWPILEETCVSCHGPVDSFNNLRLDSPDSILKGGKNGTVVVAGEPENSPIYTRTNLPADDLDVMPAEGDPLDEDQIEILRSWIAGGADFGSWTGPTGP